MYDDAKEAIGLLIVIAAVVWAVLAYNDVIYTTGTTWYDACWRRMQASKGLSQGDPIAPDPNTDILWRNCERTAEKALYDKGMIFAGLPKDNSDQRGYELQRACPSNWTDAPLGGFYIKAVELIREDGGPSYFDRVLPAEWLLRRTYQDRWPACESVRMAQGYPKIIEVSPNKFEWAQPCSVCSK